MTANTTAPTEHHKAMPIGSRVSFKDRYYYHPGTVARHTKTRIIVEMDVQSYGVSTRVFSAITGMEIGNSDPFATALTPHQSWRDIFNERQTIHLVIKQLQKKKPSDTIDTDQLRKKARRIIELSDAYDRLTADFQAAVLNQKH